MATKKKEAAKVSKKSIVVEHYQNGKQAKEIIEITGFPKNTVEGAINHWRHDNALANTGKAFDTKGNLVMKSAVKKASPKKKVAKKKAAPKKKTAKKKVKAQS